MGIWNIYYYSLDNLKSFSSSMKRQNVEQAVFAHKYNNILSHVIVDISCRDGWNLIFVKHGDGKVLKLKVMVGFRVYVTESLFRDICEYFGIRKKKGGFSTKEFFLQVNSQIPLNYVLSDENRKTVYEYRYRNDSDEGMYPIGLISWSEKNAKYRLKGAVEKHRTPYNLEKTKNLYPELYESIKDIDVSVKYGKNILKDTEKLMQGKIESVPQD